MNIKIRLIFFLFFTTHFLVGNEATKIDSLLFSLSKTTDTSRIRTLLEITEYHFTHGNVEEATEYCKQAIELSKSEKNLFFLALAYYQMGGTICNGRGDFSSAIDNLLKAYHLAEKIEDKRLLYKICNALGNTYFGQKNLEKALAFYDKAFRIASELNDLRGINVTRIGKGNVYVSQQKYEKALDLFSESAAGFRLINCKYETAASLASIGNVYQLIGKNDEALKILKEANLAMCELDDKYGIGQTSLSLGNVYQQKQEYKMALDNYYKSSNVFKASLAKYDLKDVYEKIAITYNQLGKNDSAFYYMRLYAAIKDSIFDDESARLITEMQAKYDSEKKEKENKLLQSQNELAESKIKQQSRLQIGLLLFLGMILFFSFFLYRSNKQKQKKNQVISMQKAKVEEQRMLLQLKNQDIVDSINYAKRLQEAILPPRKMVQKYLTESFIVYKPKDIVAGDFYWMEMINKVTEGAYKQLLFAVADCTGHGVPGAIVSVVCSNALNRTVKEFGITEPGEILDNVSGLVIDTFAHEDSENEVKDGMDISLISIETGTEKNSSTIKWSGANNPLWIMKKVEKGENASPDINSDEFINSEFQLIEIKADKQPIGKVDVPKPFTTHNIRLYKGDRLYLFTDGYADQFGGPDGKKFKYKQMKELLLTSAHLSMKEQGRIMENAIENWKGNLDQVDDILVIGISL